MVLSGSGMPEFVVDARLGAIVWLYSMMPTVVTKRTSENINRKIANPSI